MAEETLKRLIANEVLVDITLHRRNNPNIREHVEYEHLSVMGYLNSLAMNAAWDLDTLHKRERANWPHLKEQENDDEEEEAEEEITQPKNLGNSRRLREVFESGLEEYSQTNPSQELGRFRQVFKAYLDAFAEGMEPKDGLKFSFSYEDEDVRYAQFNLETQIFTCHVQGKTQDACAGQGC